MRRQDELERDKLRIEEQKRAALLAIESRERRLVKDRERALLAEQVSICSLLACSPLSCSLLPCSLLSRSLLSCS
jgi:hypothetical protein